MKSTSTGFGRYEDEAKEDEIMKLPGSIFIITISTGAMIFYLFTDELYSAIFAIWILLLWTFVNGVEKGE